MTPHTLLAELMKREVPPVADDARLDTIPGFDSLVMVNLVVRLESIAGRELTEAELETLRTIHDVRRLLESPAP
jgi:acyl carrier protein